MILDKGKRLPHQKGILLLNCYSKQSFLSLVLNTFLDQVRFEAFPIRVWRVESEGPEPLWVIERSLDFASTSDICFSSSQLDKYFLRSLSVIFFIVSVALSV